MGLSTDDCSLSTWPQVDNETTEIHSMGVGRLVGPHCIGAVVKWFFRNALIGIAGLAAVLAVIALGGVASAQGDSGQPVVIPSPTPYPGGWQPKGFGITVVTAPPPTVYVTENLPSAWDVTGAKAFVDKYTTAKISLVSKCPASAKRCVNIRVGSVQGGPSAAIGYTSCHNWKCSITIDTRDASKAGVFGPKTRKWLLVHELGHTFGLGHRSSCATSMYQYRRCSGHVPPLSFDSSQRAVLKKH